MPGRASGGRSQRGNAAGAWCAASHRAISPSNAGTLIAGQQQPSCCARACASPVHSIPGLDAGPVMASSGQRNALRHAPRIFPDGNHHEGAGLRTRRRPATLPRLHPGAGGTAPRNCPPATMGSIVHRGGNAPVRWRGTPRPASVATGRRGFRQRRAAGRAYARSARAQRDRPVRGVPALHREQ